MRLYYLRRLVVPPFFAIYQLLLYAAANNFEESLLEKAAFIPFTNSCFAERRMIWYLLSELETAKPAIRNGIALAMVYMTENISRAKQLRNF